MQTRTADTEAPGGPPSLDHSPSRLRPGGRERVDSPQWLLTKNPLDTDVRPRMGDAAVSVRWARTGTFARHYVEMVVVMLAGMGVLAVPSRWATDALWPGSNGDDPTLMLARMAATMTLPMIPWMRWKGHGWRPCMEMAAAMVLPAIGVIALLEVAVIDAMWVGMTVEHVAMLAAMFLVMVARPCEYSHANTRERARPRATERRTGRSERQDANASPTLERLQWNYTTQRTIRPQPVTLRHD